MKKRVIAAVCALAIVLSVCVAVLTVDVSAATKTYEVGYARVDINPWEDPYDLDGDGSKGKIMQLPLQGNSDNMNRQSVSTLMDDNGDGVIGEGDGLFASCIAVTDDDGDTVLMYSVAMVGGIERMVQETRKGLIAALKEENIDVVLPAQNIQIQGTHTHNSIALGEYKESYKDSTKTYQIQDQNGILTEATITAGEVYNNFSVWYPYFINQMVSAGVQAIRDRATATMSKGQIDAGEASGKVMNTVRHYTRVANNGEVYVWGSNFNKNNIGHKTAGDGTATVDSTGSAELVKANDTMYCLKFDFGGAKDPIALVNWRAHTTMADRDGTKLYVSSCYPNRMSYELSKKENGSYRTIFIQGAAGNINTSSYLYGSWCSSDVHKDANGDGVWLGNELSGNIYGEVLGKVAAKCLKSNMTTVDAGDIRVTNMVFNADAKSYIDNTLAQRAGKTARTASVGKYPFIYPKDVTEGIYAMLEEEQRGWYDEYSGGNGVWVDISGTYKGEIYAIASERHVTDIIQNYKETGREDVELTAFMLGENVAFVTAPGELYDRYNRNITWDDLKGKTQAGIYRFLNNSYNEWDNILSKNVGGSYGTPFVMGYANDSVGYFPNNVAYEYCKNSKTAVIGAYESHVTELAQGECEQLMDIYANMLEYLVTYEVTNNQLYREAYCEACKTNVVWEAMGSKYNNHSGNPGLASGHYYLTEDVDSAQKYVVDGDTVCVDLNSHTLTGGTRAFLLNGTGETLNIMDSSAAGTGKVQGHGSSDKSGKSIFGGGTVYIVGDNTCNLYSGTLTQAFTDISGVANGGVVEVESRSAVFNMYGGTITGGKVHWTGLNKGTTAVPCRGGNVYVYGGTFNMYDGVIENGTAQGQVVDITDEEGNVTETVKNTAYGGNVFVRGVASQDAEGNTYYTGSFNMYGGTITGGQSVSHTREANGTIQAATANGYGGNINVGNNARLNLYGGSVTGGSAGYIGSCVYVDETGHAVLSGDACVDQIYSYTQDVPNVTVSGLYTGTAQIRNRKSVPTTSGTVMGISDNAVLNTTGLMALRGDKTYTLVASGDDIVIGSTTTCACGETVVMNNLTQKLWDAYGGDLPGAHYKLAEDITAQLDPNGVELKSDVCLDLAGYDISVTTGRLYKIASGATLKIYDSTGGGQVITSGLPEGTERMEGGLFWVCANAELKLYGGTLTMDANTTTNYTQRGGIIDVQGTVTVDGGTITGGKVNNDKDSSRRAYGGNICIKAAGVVNLVSGSITGGDSSDGAGNTQVFEDGTLNVLGGTISGGTAGYGACVRLSQGGNIALSGSGSVEQVSLYAGDLTVSGTYTGTTVLSLAGSTPAEGDIVGASIDANIDDANITINNSALDIYVAGSSLVLSQETTCSACGQTAVWLPLSVIDSATWRTPGLSSGHYYLDTDEVAASGHVNILADVAVCLDLRGNNITVAEGRLFNIHGTLHLLDTVGDGIAMGHGGTSSNWGGGTVNVNASGKFYLHSGNLTQGVSDTYKATSGGVILVNGQFYMSGGSVYGGTATDGYGGNVYISNGSAVISGGSISGGSAGTAGKCVYVSSGKALTLSGNANVEEIYFGGNSAETFTISGAYTGTTNLKLAGSVDLADGTVIGISDGANDSNANISVVGSDLIVKVSGNQLVLVKAGGAQFEDANGDMVEKTLQAAVDACQGTDKVVTLTKDMEDSGVTVTKDLILDLNGMQIKGQINVSGDAKLICMDSQTGDYDVSDGIFTKLPAAMAKNAVAAKGYAKYTHDDNTVSFHKVDTNVEYVYFRAQRAGMYYSSLFLGDTYAAQEVESFGVALSIKGTPVTQSGIADHAQYSTFAGNLFEPGNQEEYASTILVDILSEKYGIMQNRQNGETVVYGCSYIKLKSGDYVVSDEQQVSLRAVVEWVNGNWVSYDDETRQAVLGLYERFPAVFRVWDTDVIAQAYKESK